MMIKRLTAPFRVPATSLRGPSWLERMRHIKNQKDYAILGYAAFQVSIADPHLQGQDGIKRRIIGDKDRVLVYRSEEDGQLYARFKDEMTTDRFEPLGGCYSPEFMAGATDFVNKTLAFCCIAFAGVAIASLMDWIPHVQ